MAGGEGMRGAAAAAAAALMKLTRHKDPSQPGGGTPDAGIMAICQLIGAPPPEEGK